jgi:hypothetical protein
MSEEQEQIALFKWAKLQENVYPALRFLHHIPNGGKRDKITAARLKAAGVKAGVPDICLPVPAGEYNGLYIEMKYGNNKPSPEQIQWLIDLAAMRHKTAVCYSMEEAKEEILAYLHGVNHE